MTNKDYSYLDGILEEVILIHFNMRYHKKLNNQERNKRIQATLDELSDDERKYIQNRTIEYFQELKQDHERNMTRKR